MTQAQVIDGYVWCDYEGDVHAATEDPLQYGPRYPKDIENEADPGNWVIRSGGNEYGESELAFWVCPGEHRPLFVIDGVAEYQQDLIDALTEDQRV